MQSRILGRELIVGQNVHAEALADVGKDPADLAGAYDAHGLAVQVEARQALEAEVEIPGADIGLVGPAVDGQQQGHGMLGHSVGRVGRDPENPELPLAGLDIHIVEAGAAQYDGLDPQLVQLIHHFGVHGVVDEDAYRVKSCCQGNGVLVQVGLKIFDFDSRWNAVAVKTGDVVGFGIKESELHNSFLLFISIVLYRKRMLLSIGIVTIIS